MPPPPEIIYTYAECTKQNLAPGSSEDVWNCVSRLIEHVRGLKEDFIVGKWPGDKNRVVFRSSETSNNLITVWPQKDNLRIDARAAGPRTPNRIDEKTISPADFNDSFETISNAIYEVFAG